MTPSILAAPRILVTPRSLTEPGAAAAAVLEPLRAAGFELVFGPPGRQPTESEIAALLPGCVGYLAGVEIISASALDGAGALRIIARNGAGVDNVDLAAAGARGIAVERAAGANAQAVAELALALILCGLRQIPASHAALREGRWHRVIGREAAGLALGIVGFGAVGRRLATATCGLRMRVRYYDVADVDVTGFDPAPVRSSLADVLAESDVVSLHAPATPDGHPLLGAAEIASLRSGGVVVNTARASLVDEAALLTALDSGQISAYCTDVFADEPPRQGALLAHPRVVLSAHIGAYTKESAARAAQEAVDRLLSALKGTV